MGVVVVPVIFAVVVGRVVGDGSDVTGRVVLVGTRHDGAIVAEPRPFPHSFTVAAVSS
jgi:hypothetical protein